jgi:DNA-binding winged helix-turn-helix (wHTH) protein
MRPATREGLALPLLDEDGLLHVGSAWVAITPSQMPVVSLLLEHPNEVVHTEAVIAACIAAGTSGHPASVRTLLTRLSRRLGAVGLELVTVRRRGVLLRGRVD